MAEGKKNGNQAADSLFKKVEDWFTQTIKSFAAAIFLLIGIGTIFGALVVNSQAPYLLFAPFMIALIAYYSRDFAIVVLVIFGLGLFLL